jgi:predicted dehydrogenase
MESRRNFIGSVAGIAGGLAASRVLGANDRIRVGMIGPGMRGTQLLGQFIKAPNAEMVAFADVYPARLAAAQKVAPSAKTYKDYRALLDDKSVDAVVISTPQHLHCEHFVAAMRAGKHVYQEKTMAFSVAHAKKMRAARLAAPKQIVQIGHQDTSSGHNQDVRAIMGQNIMGKITEIHAHMYRNTRHDQPQWTRPVPPDATAENVDWKAFLGEAPQRPFDANRFINWRFYWDYSGGNYYENMCHQLAFWYKILDLHIPTKVVSTGGIFLWNDGREVPDTMDALMVHPEGLMYTWDSGFGNNQLETSEDVLGTDGTISRSEIDVVYRPQKVNRRDGAEIKGESVLRGGQGSVDELHVRNFLECVASGKEPNCPFDLGFRISMACRMAVDSYRHDRVLKWDSKKEEIV